MFEYHSSGVASLGRSFQSVVRLIHFAETFPNVGISGGSGRPSPFGSGAKSSVADPEGLNPSLGGVAIPELQLRLVRRARLGDEDVLGED